MCLELSNSGILECVQEGSDGVGRSSEKAILGKGGPGQGRSQGCSGRTAQRVVQRRVVQCRASRINRTHTMILAPHSVQLVVLRFRFEACVAATCRNRRIVGFFLEGRKLFTSPLPDPLFRTSPGRVTTRFLEKKKKQKNFQEVRFLACRPRVSHSSIRTSAGGQS